MAHVNDDSVWQVGEAAWRVVFTAPNVVELQERKLPVVQADELLLRTGYTTISPGTELAFLSAMQNTPRLFPYEPGYTGCGQVLRCGDDVSEFARGDWVVGRLAHSAYHVVRAELCHKIPAGVDSIAASAYRIVSISLQGVRKAQVQLGECVAVIGLGLIGNFAGQVSAAAGATRVVGIDPVAARRALAQQCGFTATYASSEQTSGRLPEVIIEATGHPAVINEALRLAPPGARVILLGSSRGQTAQVNFYKDVHRKGLQIIGAHESQRGTHGENARWSAEVADEITVLDLMAGGRVSVRPLISDVVPAAGAPLAYRRLQDAKEALVTCALDWANLDPSCFRG